MPFENKKFKRAPFGFDRKDVVSYLERWAQDSESRISQSQEESRRLAAENDSLRTELSKLRVELDATRLELQQANSARDAQETALPDLEPEPPELEVLDPPYNVLELAAYRRALEFEDKAVAHANEIRAQIASIIDRAQISFSSVGQDVEATSAQLHSELRRLDEAVSSLHDCFAGLEDQLAALSAGGDGDV